MRTVKLFSIFQGKNTKYIKPNISDRGGLKSITLETLKGEKIVLTKEDVLYANDVRESIAKLIDGIHGSGKMNEKEKEDEIAKLQSRLERLPDSLLAEIVLTRK